MNSRTQPRPGGRSARIQQAVHQAVRELEQELAREALTLPRIAERAGVTPSTLYRRWGNLTELLADVTLERMRPEGPPDDTGSLAGDLLAWCHPYREELASGPGQDMLTDILASEDPGRRRLCSQFIREQMQVLVERAEQRGETAPPVDTVMELLIAPMMYFLIYTPEAVTTARLRHWVHAVTRTMED